MSERTAHPDIAPAETRETPQPAVAVSDVELRSAFSGPAVHANKIYATGLGQNVRLSFLEQAGAAVPPQFLTAVILSFADMVALRDLLSRQIGEAVEVRIEIGPDGKPVVQHDAPKT